MKLIERQRDRFVVPTELNLFELIAQAGLK
jgi:hypothetical protein